jgi:hypothetical protein
MNAEEVVEKLRTVNAKKVARESGVNYDRMAKWMQGKGLPKADDLKKLIDYFNGINSIVMEDEAVYRSKMDDLKDELLDAKDRIIELQALIVELSKENERLKSNKSEAAQPATRPQP